MRNNRDKYSTIQFTKNGKERLKKKKKPGESFEDMIRRKFGL